MEIKADVLAKLEHFGHTVEDADLGFVDYLIKSVGQEICNITNQNEVPDGLRYEWVDAVCGEFLSMKLASGKLENVGQIVKSIKEGDTSVTYSEAMTPEAQLLACIESLRLNAGRLVRYRRLTW